MLSKCYGLTFDTRLSLTPLIFLIGAEIFQLEMVAASIKKKWIANDADIRTTFLSISQANEWPAVFQEAAHYSLFSNKTLFDLRYEKKTLDVAAKNTISQYIRQPNEHCLILIRAPYLNAKQLSAFSQQNTVLIVQLIKMDKRAILNMIHERLTTNNRRFTERVPLLIQEYTAGNLLACQQLLDLLELVSEPGDLINEENIREHLSNQSHFTLFELGDALLVGNSNLAISFLKQAQQEKTETTLILWMLMQEVRILAQLLHPKQKNIPFQQLASQFKLWSTRSAFYQQACKRLKYEFVLRFIPWAHELDKQIKMGHNIWQSLELFALSLCTGSWMCYEA